ncbi:MAG: nucleotidyltransferase family protein [Firmicutes bacterium]|nr:nucleotidyltransferase family protein [Bacillota bacterium]
MHICGIICEYNPFHRGHEKQLRQVRQALGADAAIVCLMSGSFVQRGEPAIFEKRVRAQAAVLAGANLVLELPVTKALCSAEGFARGGVEIFSKLGIIDTLAFGCESGDGQAIFTAAQAMCEAEYDRALREILDTGASYPAARQRALEAIGLDGKILEKPNDILALEYCKALLQMESRIQPLALLREGDYHAEKADPDNPSATSLRTRLLSGEDLSPFVPQTAMEAYRSARQYALWLGGALEQGDESGAGKGKPRGSDRRCQVPALPQNKNPETASVRVSENFAGGFAAAGFPRACAGVR